MKNAFHVARVDHTIAVIFDTAPSPHIKPNKEYFLPELYQLAAKTGDQEIERAREVLDSRWEIETECRCTL